MRIRRLMITGMALTLAFCSVAAFSGEALSAQAGSARQSSVNSLTAGRTSGSSTITVAETISATTLDPYASPLLSNDTELALSYQCLMQVSPSGALQPALATGFSVSSNHLTYTFNLRHKVFFQNGQPFTSADVVYSYHRMFRSGSPTWTSTYTNFKGNVTAEGPYKVAFRLTAPNAGLPLLLANPVVQACAILSHTAGAAGGLSTKMTGTGPWEQVSYVPDVSLTLKRFTQYWGKKTATPNLKLLFIPDSSTQIADFQSGSVDIISPPESAVSGLKTDTNAVVSATPSANITLLEFNTEVPPFNDVNVRRAAALALNRTALAQLGYGGAATPSSDIPPSSAWGTPLAKLPYSTYDPTMAKQLLANAGYANGVPTPLTLQYIDGYDYGTNALVAAEQSELEAVGFKVTLEPEQTAAWLANAIYSYANMTITWNAIPYQADPATYVSIFSFESGTGKSVVPPGLTALTNKALKAPSTSAFEADINAIERYEANIVYPRLALLTINNFVAYQKGWTGVQIPTSGSTNYLANVKHS